MKLQNYVIRLPTNTGITGNLWSKIFQVFMAFGIQRSKNFIFGFGGTWTGVQLFQAPNDDV